MAEHQTLKQKNEPVIKAYVRAQVVIFFAIAGVVPLIQLAGSAVGVIKGGVALAVGGLIWALLASVLSGILPTSVKESLVFWRLNDVLPGCRAFTKFGPNDNRVNMNALKKRLGSIPRQPSKQNAAWYGLLKDYEGTTPAIAEDHRQYLLFRDLSAISFLLVPSLGGLTFFLSSGWTPFICYLGALIVLFVVMSIVARFKGNRLVCNVLALASKDKPLVSPPT